ncbi:MAG: hypothetical protein ACJA01_003574 [Saprospiraceae bacterium]
MTDVRVIVASVEVENPRLQISIDNLTIEIDSYNLPYEDRGYQLSLGDLGIDTLYGLENSNRISIKMDWS